MRDSRNIPWALICFVPALVMPNLVAAQDANLIEVGSRPVWGPAPRLVEEVRIGGPDDGGEEYLLGEIESIVATASGDIWVFDGTVPQLRVYDRDGRFKRNVGSKGSGPGEYGATVALLRTGFSIVAYDPDGYRFNEYAQDGAFVSSTPVSVGSHGDRVFQVDDSGRRHIRTVDPARFDPNAPRGDPPMAFLVYSPEGESLDPIPIPHSKRSAGFVVMTASGFRGPFMEDTRVAITRQGELLLGENATYTLSVMSDGMVRKRVHRDFTPVPVGSEERAEWEARARRFESDRNGPAYAPTPRTKPAFRNLWIDEENRVWIERYVEATEVDEPARSGRPASKAWQEPTVYDVITLDGDLLGTLRIPDRTYLEAARGKTIWATQTAEDGSPSVVRYRIE